MHGSLQRQTAWCALSGGGPLLARRGELHLQGCRPGNSCTSVSDMETGDRTNPPSVAEAAKILDMASEESQRTANPPLPWRFFVAMAVLLATVCAAQALEGSASLIITILGLLFIVVLGVRHVFYRSGYGVVWPDGPSVFPYLAASFIVIGVPAVLAVGFAMNWLWLVSAVGAASATLVMGGKYRKAVSSRG